MFENGDTDAPRSGARLSESCIRALTEFLHDLVFVFDRAGVVRYVNPAVKRFLGFDPDELLGQRITQLIHPDDVGKAKAGFATLVAEGGILQSTLRYRRKGGDWHVMETRTGNYLDVPEVRGFIVNARDTTEVDQLRQAVQRAEEQLSKLLGSLPVVIYRCEPSGNYDPSFISENVRFVTGFAANVFTGEAGFWQSRLHPDDAVRVPGEMAQLLDKGAHVFRYRWRVADGSYRWFLDSMRVERGEDGTPQRIVGSWQDITERIRLTEKYRVHAEEFEDLYNGAPCGLHSLDAKGVFERANDALLSWLGYERRELVGKVKFTDLLTPESRRALEGRFAGGAARGSDRFIECDLLRRDGTHLPVLLNVEWFRNAAGELIVARAALFPRPAVGGKAAKPRAQARRRAARSGGKA